MDSKLLTLLVTAFKREGFDVAKGQDFISFISYNNRKNAYGIANIIDDALRGTNYLAFVEKMDESSKREAVFGVRDVNDPLKTTLCGIIFVVTKLYGDTMVTIYW